MAGRIPTSGSTRNPHRLRLRLQTLGAAGVRLDAPGPGETRDVLVEQAGRAVREVSAHLHDSKELATEPAARGDVAGCEEPTTGQGYVAVVADRGRKTPGRLRSIGTRCRDGQQPGVGRRPDHGVSPAGEPRALVARRIAPAFVTLRDLDDAGSAERLLYHLGPQAVNTGEVALYGPGAVVARQIRVEHPGCPVRIVGLHLHRAESPADASARRDVAADDGLAVAQLHGAVVGDGRWNETGLR